MNAKRTKQFHARLTEQEYTQLCLLEKELGISRADLVRTRVLNNSGAVMINGRELLASLDHIGSALGLAASGIGELASYAAQLKGKGLLEAEIIADFDKKMTDYIGLNRELERLFRRVIRFMRD
jgi:hypothetical protein